MVKRLTRLRRASSSRLTIKRTLRNRLCAYRSGSHIYAQLISPDYKVLVSASTVEKETRKLLKNNGGNRAAAEVVGLRLADKVKKAKLPTEVAFDRSGFAYHGRIQVLAEAARKGGLEF